MRIWSCRRPGDDNQFIGGIYPSHDASLPDPTAKNIVILVHGFAAPASPVVKNYEMFSGLLKAHKSKDTEYTGFVWPSDGYPGIFSYFNDLRRTSEAARMLDQLVAFYRKGDAERRITIIAHSMGCVVAHKCKARARRIYMGGDLRVAQARKGHINVFNFYSKHDAVVHFWARLLRPGKRIGSHEIDSRPFMGRNRDASERAGRKVFHNTYKKSVELSRHIAACIAG